jgi:replicative DNA helicase
MNGHEQAVITAFLNGEQQHLIQTISVAYFPTREAQDIFRVIKELHSEMKPVDFFNVGQDNRVVASKLSELMSESFSVITLEKHIAELKQGYLRRQIKLKIVEANKMVDDGAEILDILNTLKLEDGSLIEKSAKIFNPYEQTDAYFEHVSAIEHNVLKTGINPIDDIIHGVAPGQVLTFLGRAGCFKTSFLQYCLHNYGKKSGKVSAMFSLEMPVASLVERNLQSMMGSSCMTVENHFANSSHAPETMKRYADEYKNFAVVDGRVSLDEIADYIRLINKKWSGSEVGCVGIDYMGLIESDGNDKEYEKISKIARELKHLAKEIHMPVVVLAQTNRTQADGTQEIYLHQGRGSGAIEEAADYIIGAFKSCEDETAGIIFKILKNRRGTTGSMFTVDIDKSTFKYTGKAFPWEREEKNTSFKA